MSLNLQTLGVIDSFSAFVGTHLDALSLPWPALFAVLHLTFFAAHYLFASQTAHVGALYAAFVSLSVSVGESSLSGWVGAAGTRGVVVWSVQTLGCYVLPPTLFTGVPPQLAALSLAYTVNLFGSLTHFASGQAAVYYGSGFLRTKDVFAQGAACAVLSLAIYGVAGTLWWQFLGWTQ
jgi:DASS family divalent anion:Na+ symporter